MLSLRIACDQSCLLMRLLNDLMPLLSHINNLRSIWMLLSLCGLDNLGLISLIIIIRRVIVNRCSSGIYYLLLFVVVMIFIEMMVGVMHNQALLVSHQLTLIVLIDHLVVLMVIVGELLLRINNRVVMALILINELSLIPDLIYIDGFVFYPQNDDLVVFLMVRHLLLR